jgi:hypothetical protein
MWPENRWSDLWWFLAILLFLIVVGIIVFKVIF